MFQLTPPTMIIFLIQTKIFYVNSKVVLELKWAWTQREVSGPIMKNDNAPLNIMVLFYLGGKGDFLIKFCSNFPCLTVYMTIDRYFYIQIGKTVNITNPMKFLITRSRIWTKNTQPSWVNICHTIKWRTSP